MVLLKKNCSSKTNLRWLIFAMIWNKFEDSFIRSHIDVARAGKRGQRKGNEIIKSNLLSLFRDHALFRSHNFDL